jgi:integrating conjugative element protein (TIGR03761 family)
LAVQPGHGLNSTMNADNPIPLQMDQNHVERSKLPEKPGALSGQVWLTIQTSQAQQLIRGRNGSPDKPAIIGLIGFADRMRLIWQAARNDDPFADWWLIKIHDAIEINVNDVRNRQREMDKLLQQMTAMDITIAESSRPYRMPLQFANPYAYQAALLLSEYDALVRRVLTVHHVGLLESEGRNRLIKSCSQKIRALFVIPQSYRFLKIDRESVNKATGRSHEARQVMGELPEDILSGVRQAPLVPRKVKFPTGFAGHVKLRPGSPVSDTTLAEDKNDDG